MKDAKPGPGSVNQEPGGNGDSAYIVKQQTMPPANLKKDSGKILFNEQTTLICA